MFSIPPPSSYMHTKPALVIDLDDTIIHSTIKPMGQDSFQVKLGRRRLFVDVRPGVADALKVLSSIYELFIFTASQVEYAEPIIEKVAPFIPKINRFYRDSCAPFCGYMVKDLNLLNRPLESIILVDDIIGSGLMQPKNIIGIPPWNGNVNDQIFTAVLLPLLLMVATAKHPIEFMRHVINNGQFNELQLCDA
ncbi:NLI interacting factor-like phosphatase family protein [Tritrichomonas foetus]|uniref:Mitochondrial import inner membrane translocase subunit TIM50 n=1 Tax=Tritrichomonas foetus TaxID=1144522 RepID=A0A1J4JHU2_9EUKA|nr:NLI interacting factor-like phosphatase family protein [Tritrichomonas foetus]|eukprot:OHS98736.1 NLI interacting factor-like phosphatase family protein [Tritrichomonas foetus]